MDVGDWGRNDTEGSKPVIQTRKGGGNKGSSVQGIHETEVGGYSKEKDDFGELNGGKRIRTRRKGGRTKGRPERLVFKWAF